MTSSKSILVVAAHKNQAALALGGIHSAGVDERTLSIKKQYPNAKGDELNFYTPGDRIRYWGRVGALCGLLVGPAIFKVSGLKPILTAGSRTAKAIAALEGALIVGTVSIVGASFYSLGIPRNSVENKIFGQTATKPS